MEEPTGTAPDVSNVVAPEEGIQMSFSLTPSSKPSGSHHGSDIDHHPGGSVDEAARTRPPHGQVVQRKSEGVGRTPSEGRRQEVECFHGVALRRDLLVRQGAIEHVDACGNEVGSLMAGTTPPSPAMPRSMGAKMLLKALLAVRHARRNVGDAVVNDAAFDESWPLVAGQP